MTEMQTLEIRFSGEELASYRDSRGVVYRLFYKTDNEHYAIHHDDPTSEEAWLEDGRGGLTPAQIRWEWPEMADAARLD